MIGEVWSPDTWGGITNIFDRYDTEMALLVSGGIGIFVHQGVNANGSDPYDATAYRASAYGLALSLLGSSTGLTADYWPSPGVVYDVNQDNRWFDELAVNTSGVALTAAQENANTGRGYLGNPTTNRTLVSGRGLYMRTFTNGWVFVNPKGNGAQNVQPSDVGGTSVAKFISGTQDTTRNSGSNFTANFSMPARSGLILLKRSAFGG
jgi:hypothetical protein